MFQKKGSWHTTLDPDPANETNAIPDKYSMAKFDTIVLVLYLIYLSVIPVSKNLVLPWRDPWWDERHPWSRCRSVPCRVRRPAPAPWSRTRSRETQPGSGPPPPRWSPSGISAPSHHSPGKILKLSKEEYDMFNPVVQIRMDMHWFWSAGFRSAKTTHKNRKKWRNCNLISSGYSLLKAEGFFCSMDVLYGGQGKSKSQLLI